MKTKLLLSLIACGFMMSGVDATQWETKARNVYATDVQKAEHGTQKEILNHLGYYVNPDVILEDGDAEAFVRTLNAMLDAVNASNPEKALAAYWDSRITWNNGVYHVDWLPSDDMGDVAVYNAYKNINQETVNAFLNAVRAARDSLEARDPQNPNVARLNTLSRVLIADDVPSFMKAYTPALVLLRDRVLQALSN